MEAAAGAEAAVADAAAVTNPLLSAGYRRELHTWFTNGKPVDMLEITAEHFFFGRGRQLLRDLQMKYPLAVHGLSLSLGTPGPLIRDHLNEFVEVVRVARPLWISEHIAMTRTREIQLGHLTPVPYGRDSLKWLTEHAIQLRELCQLPLILENITSHLELQHSFHETEFLNLLCQESECGLLLDLTNLAVNSKNHGFDPFKWLKEIEARNVWQFHVVGYSECEGIAYDCHSRDLPGTGLLADLIDAALERFQPRTITIERDSDFPTHKTLTGDLALLRERIYHRSRNALDYTAAL